MDHKRRTFCLALILFAVLVVSLVSFGMVIILLQLCHSCVPAFHQLFRIHYLVPEHPALTREHWTFRSRPWLSLASRMMVLAIMSSSCLSYRRGIFGGHSMDHLSLPNAVAQVHTLGVTATCWLEGSPAAD